MMDEDPMEESVVVVAVVEDEGSPNGSYDADVVVVVYDGRGVCDVGCLANRSVDTSLLAVVSAWLVVPHPKVDASNEGNPLRDVDARGCPG